MQQNRLQYLVSERQDIKKQLESTKKPKNIGFLNSRLGQLNGRLRTFGQRYNIIQVTVNYTKGFTEVSSVIYYTDITEKDAIDFTRVILESTFKIKEIKALPIPVGKLLNKVI